MSFDKIFSLRNKINENDFGPGKAKVVSDGNKIVANPIDRNSLKVKAVGYQDMIVQGRLTTEGFNGILNWLTRQPDIIDYYYKLKDLKNYFVVYEIMKDAEAFDKQVFKFTIVERSTLPTLSPIVNHVSLEEVQMIQKGMGPKDLVVSPSQQLLNDPNKVDPKKTGLTFPIAAAAIPGNKNTNLVAFFRDAYIKIKQEPNVSNYAGLANVKAEINKGELGKATQAFLYALNAGFNIKDWSGEEIATDLTEALASAIMRVATVKTESTNYFLHPNGYSLIKENSSIAGFDPNAFVAGFDQAIKGMGGGTSNTGGIVVPAEGFKYDSTGRLKNAELQKFQEIMMKNLPTYAGGALKNKPAVAAFLRTKADGIYGGKTKGLIGYLKIGLTDPKYPDNDDTTIKADFVNRMLKEFKVITENKTYIGLDGRTLIIEGFDTGAADVASGVSSGGNRGSGNNSGGTTVKKEVEPKVDSKAEFLQGKDDYSYFLKDKVWYSKKGNGPLQILLNPDSIKKLIAKAGGNYIKIVNTNGVPARADKHIYKLENKEWKVSLNGVGSWEKVNDPKELIATYGTGGSASGTKTSSETMASYARRLILAMEGGGTIMDEILSVYRKIKTRADLVALHAAFKKDGRNQGINLTYWLKGDFDVDEWKSLFKVLTANNLLDKEAKLELQYGTGNFMIFFNTYLNNYKRAAAGKK